MGCRGAPAHPATALARHISPTQFTLEKLAAENSIVSIVIMQQLPYSPSPLPDETLAFAERIFNGARAGDLPLEPLFSPPSPLLDVVCLLPVCLRAGP